MFWNITQHPNISGTRRTIAFPKNNQISKYFNFNLYKYYGRLSDLDILIYLCEKFLNNHQKPIERQFVCLMVFNATFNNISAISWRSVLLMEETGVPGEKHRPVISHQQTVSHNVVHLALIKIRTHSISGDRQ